MNWCRWGAENDLDAGTENEGWAVGVRDDGNVWVHGDDTGDRIGGEILDCSWNFSWDDCRVLDEEDTEVDGAMSLVGLGEDIWSEVVLIRK